MFSGELICDRFCVASIVGDVCFLQHQHSTDGGLHARFLVPTPHAEYSLGFTSTVIGDASFAAEVSENGLEKTKMAELFPSSHNVVYPMDYSQYSNVSQSEKLIEVVLHKYVNF